MPPGLPKRLYKSSSGTGTFETCRLTIGEDRK
jgi:hypothetical protein